ncbi:peroxisome proliferator-activated receptor gamma coactivator 1-beta [Anguilla anguilla]|uniref:peroxisome proliferator-activated receptor gamma coactivator 1-beta n=1 Tax=Anguilla anguilla TaxID=7936 RepID=UPI0015ACBE52|nr:peroxisome proliferator-activated receptor gamma coactivator 1-beta [Anguilla anguilla]
MADCASLLDEELSSFVFNYLTENSGSQYGEEEVSSDHLDTDFPDIDLSQLYASDFDSVNCLSELPWCNDQSDASPASIQYSTGDPEFLEIEEEENAALLAALTDSLDEMVEDEVGGLSVFPSLGEGPDDEDEEENEEEEEEEDLPLGSELFPGSLNPETEDPSLLKKLLLSPPNVPVSIETHKEGGTHRHSNRSQYLKPLRPLVKCERTQERKPRAVRPAGRPCTELHRHLTTTADAEDTPPADTEDESDSEEDDDDEEEEEEEGDESASEDESSAAAAAVAAAAGAPQFSSEKELRSVVELITYMHTYCLPTRKQAGWDRRDRECQGFARRARPEAPPSRPRPAPACHRAAAPRPRPAFARRREVKGHSLLRELLETVDSFDVSKPYRLHSPPYSRCGGAGAQEGRGEPAPRPGKPELKDSGPTGLRDGGAPGAGPDGPKAAREPEAGDTTFSVRRSRRLASFPGRFSKRSRAGAAEHVSWRHGAEVETARRHPAEEAAHGRTPYKADDRKTAAAEPPWSLNEKRACLCLPLTPKATGDTQFANKAFEQTLSVELCGTAGLTPPTTPPHKPAEDELFKPEGKGESPPKGFWASRAPASRKLPEQTELYAQLRRMGQASEREAKGAARRAFGDHDYCLQGLGESRKRPAPSCGEEEEEEEEDEEEEEGSWAGGCLSEEKLFSKLPDYLCGQGGGTASPRSASPQALSPRNTEESAGCSPRPSSPNLHAPCTSCCLPHSSSSKLSFSCENLGTCYGDKLRSKVNEDCRVFYIHNLPSGVTQAMLRRRFQAFGEPDDCKIITKNDERCGVITFLGPPSGQGLRRRRDPPAQNARSSPRRFCRKRYIDLDEAGPGPVKSKYDALDFDTLLKEAQRSLHR